MLKEVLLKAREHPLLTFAWTLFVLSVSYLGTREIAFPDTADYFEKARLEISLSQMEYDRASKILDAYRRGNEKILASTKKAGDLVDQKFPNISDEDTKYIRDSMVEEREELSKTLALLRNAHFDNPSFTELNRVLESDSVYTDTFILKRIQFLDLIKTDFKKAQEMKPTLEGVDENRKLYELSAREPFIESTMERARQEFNAKLRTAQRKETLYKLQSNVALAAWVYTGGFLGGWISYFYRTWRKRKPGTFDQLE